jgi:hypothetical protein
MIDELCRQREQTGLRLIETVSQLANRSQKEVAALATIISASVTYLAMLEDFCPEYNGIPLSNHDGWEHICNGIDLIIDNWFESMKVS